MRGNPLDAQFLKSASDLGWGRLSDAGHDSATPICRRERSVFPEMWLYRPVKVLGPSVVQGFSYFICHECPFRAEFRALNGEAQSDRIRKFLANKWGLAPTVSASVNSFPVVQCVFGQRETSLL